MLKIRQYSTIIRFDLTIKLFLSLNGAGDRTRHRIVAIENSTQI